MKIPGANPIAHWCLRELEAARGNVPESHFLRQSVLLDVSPSFRMTRAALRELVEVGVAEVIQLPWHNRVSYWAVSWILPELSEQRFYRIRNSLQG